MSEAAIPAGWDRKPIKTVAKITTGDKDTKDRVANGLYPFFVRSQTVERINSVGFDGEGVLTAGDGVGTGKIFHYINGKCDFHQRVYLMHSFSEGVTGRYFFYYFSHFFYERIMAMTAKSSVDSVRREMIADMEILFPKDNREQERVVAALSEADGVVEGLERVIAKKRLIKQGAMQDLLTARRRLPGFTGEWVAQKLGACGQFFKGSGVRKDDANSGELPCVRYGELYTVHHDVVRTFASHISEAVARTARPVRRGDILFAGSGETKEEIGKCAVIVHDGPVFAGGDIVCFRPTNADGVFLSYMLNGPEAQKQKASLGQGDAVVHISANALSGISIPLPSVDEQRAISEVLEAMDAEIQTLDARLTKARAVKEGMMQNLLTGRVRLV